VRGNEWLKLGKHNTGALLSGNTTAGPQLAARQMAAEEEKEIYAKQMQEDRSKLFVFNGYCRTVYTLRSLQNWPYCRQ